MALDLSSVPWSAWFPALAAVLMAVLAVVLLRLDAGNRVMRALAWFLLLRAGLNSLVFSIMSSGVRFEDVAPWTIRVNEIYNTGVTFAILWFALVYAERFGTLRGRLPRGSGAVVLALALSAMLAWFLGPAWVTGTRAAPGLLYAAIPVKYAILSLVSFMLLRDAVREEPGPRRTSLRFVAVGLWLDPVWHGVGNLAALVALPLGVALPDGLFFQEVPFRPALAPLHLVPVLLLVLALATLLRARRAHGPAAAPRPLLAALALPAVAVPVWWLAATAAPASATQLFMLVDGMFVLAVPALAGYALLRHQLFDLDLKLKVTLQKGTVAAAFVLVFFVVATVAQEFLADHLGWLTGGVAAGALLFGLAPLQRVAERIADSALPHAKPFEQMSDPERVALYRDQVRLLWSDGTLTRKDRLVLANLRERLGLDAALAARVEDEAVAA